MVNTADTWKFRAEEWCKWLNALPGSSRSTEIATIPQLLAVAVQHHQAGQLAEAESRYRQILVQQPNHANAIHLLGVVAYQNKLYDDSADLIRRAIALVPKLPQAHNSLGNTLQALGQTDEAIACFRRALVLNPNSVDARFNLGNAHRLRGEFDDAMACYKQTLALQPGHAPAQTDLAAVLLETGHTQEAIAGHRRATNVQPDYVPAHNNLGIALHETGQLDEAIASYRRALTLDPYYAMAHSNLGNVLRDTGKPDEAIASHRRAVALRPDLVAAHGDLVFAMHFHPGYDAAMISREERAWDHLHARPLKAHIRPHENDRSPDRRLRIGYVSADFRDHACAFFLDPLLRCHDHHHFEIICYAQISAPDSFTQRCQTYADRWRSTVGLSDEQVADQIRQDGIDVLVDLKLHTDRNRLLVFARKPAPVQVSWLGYPGSTGISTIEYRLTDRYLEPPDVNDESGGEAIRLPDCFWCYDPLTDQPPVNDLPALRSGHFTFGCLNAFAKINQRVLELWAATMAAVPDSRLLLLAPRGDCRRWALDILDRHGVSSDRVEISDRLPRPQYLQLYHRIDLGLDCFPYNGHTTNLDSLWMGVPMVTLIGQTAVGRAGWSQLCNLDLKELAAKTPEQFVRIAAGFAGDLPKLSRLRSTLRQRMEQSPLMDAPRFARNVESAYRQMWRKWCEAC
jgi:predicted O-linked N-acetylglucosamine transferase (SPINDLY family)